MNIHGSKQWQTLRSPNLKYAYKCLRVLDRLQVFIIIHPLSILNHPYKFFVLNNFTLLKFFLQFIIVQLFALYQIQIIFPIKTCSLNISQTFRKFLRNNCFYN